jgi:hypothetical protein
MNVKDIDGALPKQPKIRATPYDALVYQDVYQKDWKTRRSTNPLQPEYQVRD